MDGGEFEKLKKEVLRYSKLNGYPVSRFEAVECGCNQEELLLFSNDNQGGAFAECPTCSSQIDIMNSREYAEDPDHNVCSCENKTLLLGVGLALYDDGTGDVRWVYVGALCRKCGLAGVYTDWQER